MLHADLSFFETLPDSALVREKLIIGKANNSGGNGQTQSPCLIPVSRSTWYRMVKAGQAPAPIKLHTGVSAWRVGDLRGWLASRSDSPQQSNSK
jgi:predicted DNA-binding transcriptional regulator AlpA